LLDYDRRLSARFIITITVTLGLFIYTQGLAFAVMNWFADDPDLFAHEDVYIQADQKVGKLLVVGGNVTVDGKITDGVIVIDGNLIIRSSAQIKDDIFVLGGYMEQQEEARVTKDVLVFAPRAFPLAPFVAAGLLCLGAVSLVIIPFGLWFVVRIFKRTALYSRLEQRFKEAEWQWSAVYILASLAISGLMLGLFTEVAWTTIFRHTTNVVDDAVIWLVRYYASPALDRVMIFITSLGYSIYYGVFVAATILTLLYYRRWLEATGLSICLVGGVVLNVLLKHLFERSRPDLFRVVVESGYSFPSGHAMVSLCYYGMLAFLFARSIKSGKLRLIVMIDTILLVVAIGVSRIYLGVHYPTDILAGYAAGATWLAFCIALLIWWEKRRVVKEDL